MDPTLKEISMEIPQGRVSLILGKSGSGKTSLLRCIAQLEKAYSGEIVCSNQSLKTISHKERGQALGFVSQSYALFPHQHVIDNCTHPLQVLLGQKKQQAYERAKEILYSLGIDQHLYALPHELSGGQQQRVAIARALVLDPTFLLFDELTSALDPEDTRIFIHVIKKLCKGGKGIVTATQDMAFAANILDRAFFLENGSLIEA